VLERPAQRNAITAEMLGAIVAALEAARTDDELRCIAITAVGDHFCSGMDLAASNAEPPQIDRPAANPQRRARLTARHQSVDAGPHRLIELLLAVELPVLVCVRGTAAGLGCALALAADVAVVGDTARFIAPYLRRGFTPDCGLSYLLPRLVGLARAREMLLRGTAVDAHRAARWGLIADVTPDDEVEHVYQQSVGELLAGATVAIGLTKWLLNQNALQDVRTAMQRESLVLDLSLRTKDFKSGIRAFLDGHPAEFEGR
jgi:2-(1,2-epoxy-1,2-dihydrophenyl)acetyl-CoA isomerase